MPREMSCEMSREMSRKIVLVFDVETSGLLPKHLTPENTPYVLQLGFVLYDTQKQSVIQTYNEYIRPPENVVISDKITEITGITRSMVDEKGIDIETALRAFYVAFLVADVVVAHNIEFDWAMLILESSIHLPVLARVMQASLPQGAKTVYCTMKEGMNLCQIQRMNSRGVYFKYPTLAELYKRLFGDVPADIRFHDAEADVLCCLKCFLEMTK
jgi:DNA polymerase-3 subunit epsilon